MAGETLQTKDQLLAAFPDNTAGLIRAVDSRNLIVSVVSAVGFMEDASASFTMTLDPGVATSVNASVTPSPGVASNYWKLNGNQAWIPSYVDDGIIVPAGVIRLVNINTFMYLDKIGGGLEVYSFQFFVGGVAIGEPSLIELDGSPEGLSVFEEILYEPALDLPIELRVTSQGGDDLTVLDFRQRVFGVLL